MKTPAITKPFKLKFNRVVVILCVILTCFSCKKDDTIPILVDITGEPDKVIENVLGTLYYNNGFKMWEVLHSIPETINSIDLYLIAEMLDSKFPFKEGKQVTVSGLCYEIPSDIYFDFRETRNSGNGVDDIKVLKPSKIFYIKATDLKYKN